jgi:hypothetical protein
MAFVPPTNVTVGSVLTASKYNQEVVENVKDIRAAQINVASTTKTDTFSMSATTYADVTGLAVTITPSSATSKILVIASVFAGTTIGGTNWFGRLLRDSTPISVGTSVGSRTAVSMVLGASADTAQVSATHLDSPGTTSLVTYKVQIRSETAGQIVYVNRRTSDTDVSQVPRGASSITVIEVPV